MKIKIYLLTLLSFAVSLQAEDKPSPLQEFKDKVAKVGKGSISITDLAGDFISKVPMPSVIKKAFSNLKLSDIKSIEGPMGPEVRSSTGIEGKMTFNNASVKGILYVALSTKNRFEAAVIIETPKEYKLSSLVPDFKALDVLKFPKSKFILSTFKYQEDADINILPGLTFKAYLDYEGPLAIFKLIKNEAKKIPSIKVEDKPIVLSGIISQKVEETKFEAVIPIGIGLDFTKIKDVPKSITDIFKSLSIDQFGLEIIVPPKLKFTVEGGIKIVLATQRDPLLLSMIGVIEPKSLGVGARMRNMLDLRVIKLGNAGFQIDWDQAVMPIAAALGVPFTGIGLYGDIVVGKGKHAATFKVAGGVNITSNDIPDIVIDVSADNIHFDDIIKLLLKVAKVDEGNLDFLPDITLNKLRGYLATSDTVIAKRKFKAGFGFDIDAEVLGHKAVMKLDIDEEDKACTGNGYTKQIVAKIGKTTIFKLSGKGPDRKKDTPDDGPYMDISFYAKNLAGGKFIIDGTFEVPIIGIKQAVDFEYKQGSFKGSFEQKLAGFDTKFSANLNPKEWKQMGLSFSFQNNFAEMLTKQAKPALQALKKEATKELAKIDAQIVKLSKEIEKAKKSGMLETQKEINKTKRTIKAIHNKIARLKRECDRAPFPDNLVVCPRVGTELTAQGLALAAQESYLNLLLKPGKEVIKGVLDLVKNATKEIGRAKILQKTVGGVIDGLSGALELVAKGASIFRLKKAAGSYNTGDIVQAKLPKLEELTVEINIPGLKKATISLKDMQFDFKRPDKSLLNIAEKLVKSIKIK